MLKQETALFLCPYGSLVTWSASVMQGLSILWTIWSTQDFFSDVKCCHIFYFNDASILASCFSSAIFVSTKYMQYIESNWIIVQQMYSCDNLPRVLNLKLGSYNLNFIIDPTHPWQQVVSESLSQCPCLWL